ncbi:MAG: HAD family phosphatase [Prevotellaceae bacterium]|nr:HAD family phosphatase [Prevotellaceae bacterium]
MIRNIIIDFGGVLVRLDKSASIKAFRDLGMDVVASYINDYRSEAIFRQLEHGEIDMKQFCNEARRLSGVNAPDEAIEAAWLSLLVGVPQERLDKILELRKKYHVFLLSNTNAFHWDYSVKEYFKDTDIYFEKMYLSYKIGLTKPDRRIFELMLADAGIKADESLLLDDSADNCKMAEELGIHTMLIGKDEDWTVREI